MRGSALKAYTPGVTRIAKIARASQAMPEMCRTYCKQEPFIQVFHVAHIPFGIWECQGWCQTSEPHDEGVASSNLVGGKAASSVRSHRGLPCRRKTPLLRCAACCRKAELPRSNMQVSHNLFVLQPEPQMAVPSLHARWPECSDEGYLHASYEIC